MDIIKTSSTFEPQEIRPPVGYIWKEDDFVFFNGEDCCVTDVGEDTITITIIEKPSDPPKIISKDDDGIRILATGICPGCGKLVKIYNGCGFCGNDFSKNWPQKKPPFVYPPIIQAKDDHMWQQQDFLFLDRRSYQVIEVNESTLVIWDYEFGLERIISKDDKGIKVPAKGICPQCKKIVNVAFFCSCGNNFAINRPNFKIN